MLTNFPVFCEGPKLAVVKEYTCNISIERSDFDSVADVAAIKNVIQSFESIYRKNLSAVDIIFRV